jgi:hypothetical protein
MFPHPPTPLRGGEGGCIGPRVRRWPRRLGSVLSVMGRRERRSEVPAFPSLPHVRAPPESSRPSPHLRPRCRRRPRRAALAEGEGTLRHHTPRGFEAWVGSQLDEGTAFEAGAPTPPTARSGVGVGLGISPRPPDQGSGEGSLRSVRTLDGGGGVSACPAAGCEMGPTAPSSSDPAEKGPLPGAPGRPEVNPRRTPRPLSVSDATAEISPACQRWARGGRSWRPGDRGG